MITFVDSTLSTNTLLWEQLKTNPELEDLSTVYTNFQQAGRGQAGNSWESQDGKNLLFSTLFRLNNFKPQEQFLLNEVVSVSIVRVLRNYVPDVLIKWPNDIYYKDKKMGGILIEGQITGENMICVAGAGININQEEFVSAPNPISMKQIMHIDNDPQEILHKIIDSFNELLPLLEHPEELKKQYTQLLYRREGYHLYMEAEPTPQPMMPANLADATAFVAKIVDITSQGCIVLETTTGEQKSYHFKQIRYIIPKNI